MTEFTTSCFIRKNNQELRNKLEKLGYEILNSKYKTISGDNIDKGIAIITYKDSKTYAVVSKIDNVVKYGRIDCDEDEDLFFAIITLCNNNAKKYYILRKTPKSFKIFKNISLKNFK